MGPTMTAWGIAVIAVASATLAVVGIALLVHARRAAQETSRLIQQEVVPLLRDLRNAAARVDALADNAEASLGQIRRFGQEVEQSGRRWLGRPNGMGHGIGSVVWRSIVMGAGVRAAIQGLRWWQQRTSAPGKQEVANGR